MTTPARAPLQPRQLSHKWGRCACCLRPFRHKATGRLREYCSKECRWFMAAFRRMETMLEIIVNRPVTKALPAMPPEGKARIRARLWSLANRFQVNKGVKGGNEHFRKRRGNGRPS